MRLTDDDISKKIEAITSLESDWRWKEFTEVILYYQGLTSQELFSKKFLALDAVTKDKEHAAIVRSLNALNFVLDMPNWLSKRSWKRWDQVEKQIGKEIKNGRRT
jgi:hypothetical protein